MLSSTVRVDSLPHRKWKGIKQQPGTAGPGNMLGCCLIYFHFLQELIPCHYRDRRQDVAQEMKGN